MSNNTSNIFNKKVLEKRLARINLADIPNYAEKIKEIKKWKDAALKGNLIKTKETSVQGSFLTRVFEKILGYKSFVEDGDDYNMIPEHKTKLDGTESDAALGFFTKQEKTIKAVLELKDATTDLDKKQHRSNHLTPIEQAFNYAHKNGSSCVWVIVSNFIEIRLYKSNSSLEYERFLLADLDDELQFKKFYYLLSKDNLICKAAKSNVDLLFEESEQAGQAISSEFYFDYKNLRENLFKWLRESNPAIDPLTLFSKTQKILDRFIFICFCESGNLLPKDLFKNLIKDTQELSQKFFIKPTQIWDQLKGLFTAIDKGHPPMKINAYNGGLFKADELLDSLTVTDEMILPFLKLSKYDFETDLNVNILGHIFEHSISDIEQIKAEISGEAYDRKDSRQKKDGIYYTPAYVTEYIVKQTIGRWFDDKKAEIKKTLFATGSFEAVIEKTQKGVVKKTYKLKAWKESDEKFESETEEKAVRELHIRFYENYIEAICQIKILDPACGSGAFLNQAFDYIYKEATYSNGILQELRGGQISAFDWNKFILQNNLYGVDLNSESVEITRLSLWLKTANSHEPLASLDDTIKCGNSIIASKEIAGERAFDWGKEFPQVFKEGGFDIVIGNPPYGARLSQAEKDYITANYKTTEYNFDTYKTFMELGLRLTKPNGYMGYITPNTYFVLEKGANELRKFLFEKHTLLNIAELFNVFPNAVVEPAISVYKNKSPVDTETFESISVPRKTNLSSTFVNDGVKTVFEQANLKEKEGYIFNFRETEREKQIIKKITNAAKPLSEYFKVTTGVKPYQKGKGIPPQTQAIIDEKPFDGYERIDDSWLPYIRGGTINRYTDAWNGEYIKYGEWLAEPRNAEMFRKEKLFIRQTGDYPIANYDASGKIGKNTIHCIYHHEKPRGVSLKHVLGIVNSILMKWVFQHDNFHIVGKPLAETKKIYVERLPIIVAKDQTPIITLVDKLLQSCQARFDKAKQFMDYLTAVYALKSITENLSEFYKLSFKTFLDELKKQKVKLSPKQEMDLMPLFQEKSKELVTLSKSIEKTETELDILIYKLYNLTPEEISIVEGCTRVYT